MSNYDEKKMSDCAAEIRKQVTAYNGYLEEINSIVTKLKTHWDDENNTEYAKMYDSKGKVAAETVSDIMAAFAKALDGSSEGFTELKNKTRQGING